MSRFSVAAHVLICNHKLLFCTGRHARLSCHQRGQKMSDISVKGLPAGGAPFRVGDVLSKAFSVFGSKLGSFLLLAFVPMIPLLALILLGLSGPQQLVAQPTQTAALAWLSGIMTFALSIVAQAMTLYAAFQQMAGRPFNIGQSLGVGFGRLVPVVCVALLSALFTGVAFILLFVPGLIVICMLYVAVPVCVIEKPGIFASLDRSAKLTKGSRWQIFGLIALVFIVGIIVQLGLKGVFGIFGIWGELLNFGFQVIATSFGAVLVAVVYHELRMTKEGIDIDNLANVFD
jgi:hypothetical protein